MATSWRVGLISSAGPIIQIPWELSEVPGLRVLQAGHGMYSMSSGNLALRNLFCFASKMVMQMFRAHQWHAMALH